MNQLSPESSEMEPYVDEVSYIKLGLLLVLLVVLMASPLYFSAKSEADINQNILVASLPVETKQNVERQSTGMTILEEVSPFDSLELEAKAAFVWDINNQTSLYSKNATTQLPLASLTKLMTALTASSFIRDNENIVISEAALQTEGDSGLLANETWLFKDLRDFMLIVSSNDGAEVLSAAAQSKYASSTITDQDLLFVKKMNEISRELKLTQTYFLNETGLDPSEAMSGGYGSARDMARLMEYLLEHNPDILHGTTQYQVDFVSLDKFIHPATNTNELIPHIPALLGSKTGYTDLAGGNLAIAFNADLNRPVIAVVLGSSLEGRFTDIQKLVTATLAF